LAASIFDIPVERLDGTPATLAEHRGKVLLIVNVASKCGLTPQYEGLENLYETYGDAGLVVLGFPANDFMGQEPGSNEEIGAFCRSTYGVAFPMYSKITVKGPGKHPLYEALIKARPQAEFRAGSQMLSRLPKSPHDGNGEIHWNFEKFLVDRSGAIRRFAPDTPPKDPAIVEAVEKALAGAA